MIVNCQLGTITMERLKEFVLWLEKAPLSSRTWTSPRRSRRGT